MRDIDLQLAALAKASNTRFTRYADDIVFSCSDKRKRVIKDAVRHQLHYLRHPNFGPVKHAGSRGRPPSLPDGLELFDTASANIRWKRDRNSLKRPCGYINSS